MEEMQNLETKKSDQIKRFSVNLTKMNPEEEQVLLDLHRRVNDKDFGKKVDWMEIAKFAMIKLAESDALIKELQDSSMNEDDLLKMEFDKFKLKNPDRKMSFKEFLVYKVLGKKGLEKIH